MSQHLFLAASTPDNVSRWVGIVGVLVVVVTFLGVVVVYLRGSADKGSIESLKRAVDARDDEISGMKLTIERCHATEKVQGEKIAALEIRLEAVERENVYLRSLRPSAEAIASVKKDTVLIREGTTALVSALIGEGDDP